MKTGLGAAISGAPLSVLEHMGVPFIATPAEELLGAVLGKIGQGVDTFTPVKMEIDGVTTYFLVTCAHNLTFFHAHNASICTCPVRGSGLGGSGLLVQEISLWF